jgi:hypothetical protein
MNSRERQQQELQQLQEMLDKEERGQMDQQEYRVPILKNAIVGIFTIQRLGALSSDEKDGGGK